MRILNKILTNTLFSFLLFLIHVSCFAQDPFIKDADNLFAMGKYTKAYKLYMLVAKNPSNPHSATAGQKLQVVRNSMDNVFVETEKNIAAMQSELYNHSTEVLKTAIEKEKLHWIKEGNDVAAFNPFKHISHLDLSNSGLVYLPENLFDYDGVIVFDLRGNPNLLNTKSDSIFKKQKSHQKVYIETERYTPVLSFKEEIAQLDSLSNLVGHKINTFLIGLNRMRSDASAVKLVTETELDIEKGNFSQALGKCFDASFQLSEKFAYKKSTINELEDVVLQIIDIRLCIMNKTRESLFELRKTTEKFIIIRAIDKVLGDSITNKDLYDKKKWEEITAKVKQLDFSNFGLKELPTHIKDFSKVEFVNLIGNEFESWGQTSMILNELNSLKSIYLSVNNFSNLPSIKAKITGISITKSNLKGFPPGLDNHTQIIYLDFSGIKKYSTRNKMHTLSKKIEKFKNLEYLNLSDCGLTHLTKELGGLKKLKALYLAHNNLRNEGKTTWFETDRLKNLAILDLSFNKLKIFPKRFLKLKQLEWLDLSKNEIKQLPNNIDKLENLKYLNLSRNQIKQIPVEITQLKNLEILNLYGNGMVEFPQYLQNLDKLKTIYLGGNKFPDETLKLIKEWMKDCKVDFDYVPGGYYGGN